MSDEAVMTDAEELDAWLEWKDVCEIDKCSPETQTFLKRIGNAKANSLARSYKVGERIDYGFHIFENYAVNTNFVKTEHVNYGKSYKDGVFLAAADSDDPPLKVIRGKFNAYLNTEIKNMFFISDRNFAKQTLTKSLSEKLNDDGSTWEDLIPDVEISPGNEMALMELMDIAVEDAEELLSKLNAEERALLACQHVSLRRSDPFVMETLRTNTSHVSDVLNKNIPKKISAFLAEKHPAEDAATLTLLRELIATSLKSTSFSWLASEKSLAPLLKYLRERKADCKENE